MRVLSFSNCPLEESQGSGYVILGYTRGLVERGHSVELLGPDELALFSQARRGKTLRLTAGMWWAAERKLALGTYDVVEFYGGESWLAASLLASRPRDYMLVSHSNGLEPFCAQMLNRYLGTDRLDGKPQRWYERELGRRTERAFSRVDGLVTVSEVERDYALAAGYQPPGQVVAIDNPLPPEYLDLPMVLERPPVVGYCGSWLARKGSHLIQSDLPPLLREFPEWRLRLIGVGGDFCVDEHFPADVRAQVEVVPFLRERQAMRVAYQGLAILVAPSIYESFGLSIAEAMACGCAVVAGRTGFAGGLRDAQEAMLLEEPVAGQLQGPLRRLMAEPELRRRIAATGHRRVQSLRWSQAVERLEQIYTEWLARRRACADRTVVVGR